MRLPEPQPRPSVGPREASPGRSQAAKHLQGYHKAAGCPVLLSGGVTAGVSRLRLKRRAAADPQLPATVPQSHWPVHAAAGPLSLQDRLPAMPPRPPGTARSAGPVAAAACGTQGHTPPPPAGLALGRHTENSQSAPALVLHGSEWRAKLGFDCHPVVPQAASHHSSQTTGHPALG